MSKPYLEVTYRQGKPFAAYLYLDRRPGDKAVMTRRENDFLVDYNDEGRAIGIEFTRMDAVPLSAINQILKKTHAPSLTADDLAPLTAA